MDHRIISQLDYQQYIENLPNNKVQLLWASMVSQLSSEQLKKEARAKGFALVAHPTIKEDGISRTFTMTVPNGSIALLKELNQLHNVISFIKD